MLLKKFFFLDDSFDSFDCCRVTDGIEDDRSSLGFGNAILAIEAGVIRMDSFEGTRDGGCGNRDCGRTGVDA
jgi:hypothetical protein